MTQHEIIIRRSGQLYLMQQKGLSLSDCEEFVLLILADSTNLKT